MTLRLKSVCFRHTFDGVFVYMCIKERAEQMKNTAIQEKAIEMGVDICEMHTRRGVSALNYPSERGRWVCLCILFPQSETVTLSSGHPLDFNATSL